MNVVFCPVLAAPGGDRNATRALIQALKKKNVAGQYDVSSVAIEGFGLKGTPRALDTIRLDLEQLKKRFPNPHKVVLVYSGGELIKHLHPLKEEKMATANLNPEQVMEKVFDHVENTDSCAETLHMMYSCPAYCAQDLQHPLTLQQPGVLYTQGVPALFPENVQQVKLFDKARDTKYLAAALPMGRMSPAAVVSTQEFMADMIRRHEQDGYKAVLVSSQWNDPAYLAGLQEKLKSNTHAVLFQDDVFAAHVLPAIRRNPESHVLLCGTSASMMAEATGMLAPDQILVDGVTGKKSEHQQMIRYFHENLRAVSLVTRQGIVAPSGAPVQAPTAADAVAEAMIRHFTGDTKLPVFALPEYLPEPKAFLSAAAHRLTIPG